MIGVNTSIFKSAGRKLVNLLGTLKNRATYYENGTDSTAEKNRIESLGILDDATILLTPTATSDARVHSVKTYTGDELVTGETSKSVNTGGVYTDILTNINATLGQKLQVTYTLTGIEGDIQVWNYTNYTRIYGLIHSTDGTYTATIDITGNNSSLDLRFYSPSGRTGTISNVSVVDVSSDFDFDRASSATRINSSGLVQDMQSITDPELVVDGDFPNGDNWNEGSSWTIADNKATATANGYLIQNNTFLALSGQTYSLTYTISNTNDASLQLAGGSNPFGATNLPRTNGTHTVYLTTINTTTNLQFYSNGFRGDLSNVSSKNITFSTDVDLARINYDSNGDNGHILLEPTSTNLVGYSLPNDTNWSKGTNTTITENYAVSPDGTQNASRFVMPTGSGTYAYYQFTATSTTDHTLSFYAKNNGGDADVIMAFFVASQTQNITLTNEWQRFEFTTSITSGNSVQVGVDNITSVDMLIYGVQCEALPYATSYIPTLTGSTVTRAAETLTGSGNSTLIDTTQGTIYLESKLGGTTGTKLFSIGGGTNNADPAITIGYTGQNMYMDIVDSGSLIATPSDRTITGINTSSYNKMAIKYTTTNVTVYLNGEQKHTETIDFTPAINVLKALYAGYGVGSKFEGEVKALAYFNEALSDSELETLTSQL